MGTPLTRADRRILYLAAAVAAVCLAVSVRYFHRAFPEASLDLRVGRADSEAIALRYLAARGVRVDGYRHTAVFAYSDNTKLYLERSAGLERMNQLTSGPVHLWRWSHRWFRPQQQEEFSVEVTPQGDVVAFRHRTRETDAGANLDSAAARAIAEQFLVQAMHRDLSDLEFLQSQTNQRPARTDHDFTWKQKSVDLGDGSLRIAVGVQGDRVASYSEYVRVPEQWQRDYEQIRSRNDTAQTVDQVFFFLLSAAMLVMLVLRVRNHDVPVRTAAGFAVTGAVLYFLSQANDFGLAKSWYSTTESYSSFVAAYFGEAALSALGVAAFIFFLVAAAEPEYRHAYPDRLPLRRYLSWQGLRTRSFLMANVVGLTLAFFFFAYQTIFYLLANKLGAWAPSDIPFTNELNTTIPWAGVLFGGFLPAVSEEMQFRAFAIPFLRRFVRSLPVAIVLAAFNWGFLHSAYPNQPFFIRGLEVGLGGILIGFIMVRFGILATLIWHYSVDALYSAFLLLRSPNHYLFTSGAITAGIMVLPLVVAAVAYLRSGAFADEAAMVPAPETATVPATPVAPAAAPAIAYPALSARQLRWALAAIAVFAAVAAIPAYRFGQGIKLRMTAAEAKQAADAYLRSHGVDPDRYRRAITINPNLDSSALRYLFERIGLQRADELYRHATQTYTWDVRYFRPLEVEEHAVIFDAVTRSFVDHRVTLDENAPGATLDTQQARALAEKALQDRGFRLAEFDLQQSFSDKRKARQDYTFVWQAKPGDFRDVGEEKYRASVTVAGDQVTDVSDSFKLPEEWLRQRRQNSLANTLLALVSAALALILFARAIILFIAQLRSGRLAWREAAPVAVAAAVVSLVSDLNGLPAALQSYSTSISLTAFWLQVGTGMLVSILAAGLGAWLLVALALGLLPAARALGSRAAARLWRRDAAVAALVLLAAAAALDKITLLLSNAWPAQFFPTLDFAPALNTWSPALGGLCSALLFALFTSGALAVLITIVVSGWARRAWWLWLAAALFLLTLGPANAHSVREYLSTWILHAGTAVLFCAVAAAWFRENLLAYPVALFALEIIPTVISLVSQDARFYLWNGVLLALLAAAVLAWYFVPSGAAEEKPAASAAAL